MLRRRFQGWLLKGRVVRALDRNDFVSWVADRPQPLDGGIWLRKYLHERIGYEYHFFTYNDGSLTAEVRGQYVTLCTVDLWECAPWAAEFCQRLKSGYTVTPREALMVLREA
jgi:hypothetical protein